jgi:branched-chain amino acid transport system permease protein
LRTARSLLFTALIAALLFVPFIGLRINESVFPVGLSYHWGWCLGAIAAAVIVRLLFHVIPDFRSGIHRIERKSHNGFRAVARNDSIKFVWPLLTLLALVLPLCGTRETIDLATLILIYAMLASGLNIVVGFAGLLDLGFIGFFAIGAYSYALIAQHYGLSFWVCLPLSILLPAATSLLLGLPVLRLRGDYFAIVTLGFGQIVYTLLVNCQTVTHGSQGISGIPRPSLFGIASFSAGPQDGLPSVAALFHIAYSPAQRVIFLYYLLLAMVALVLALTARLRRLPLGRAWEAVREDEIAAASLGINRTRIKLSAYAISAGIAGLAGAFFAARQGFISPESFTFMDSAIVLAIVVLGGMGSSLGLILAACFLIGLPEIFRALADYRMLIFGAAMVAMMLVRPRGLISTRQPTVRLL